MRLSDERCEEIKLKSVELLEHCHVGSFPLDAHAIITCLGCHLFSYSSLNEEKRSACMERSNDAISLVLHGSWYVLYNDKMGNARIRMTLMHEVAHRWLRHSCDSDLAESEASFFAKYIIAPPVIINSLDLDGPSQIMSCFGNSHEAAEYSWNYYRKWLMYSGKDYSEQETRLLRLFDTFISQHNSKEAIAI